MKELILIPCSGRKRDGSSPNHSERTIENNISSDYSKKLKLLRKEIFKAFNFEKLINTKEFMPAFYRYSGNIYKKISKKSWDSIKTNKAIEIVIISAYYGLIYWNEKIIKYNVSMNDTIYPRRKLSTWWRNNGLPDILAQFINYNQFKIVKSFLSQSYQVALGNIQSKIDIDWLQYEYPQLGSGSDYYRGLDINKIFMNQNIECPRCNSNKTRRVSKTSYFCISCNLDYMI